MPDDQDRTNLLNSLVALAQGAIKAAMFVNGAGAVALLAFVGQIWSRENTDSIIHTLVWSVGMFAVGVLLAGLGTILAYFVQLKSYNYTVNGNTEDWKASECLRHVTVVVVACAYLPFVAGIIWTLLNLCSSTTA